MTESLADIVAHRRTLIICGSGGVGKTTTAAVLAMHAARLGRSAVVVTIDPARRLAQALGLEELGNIPRLIDPELWDPAGTRLPGGQLSAVMLDAKSTFDNLVMKYASGPDQAERILSNTFYRNISSALSGTQEYMAMEKLYELHEEGENDFVVVDTPPSRNALDFLEAPDRLTRFLEGRVFRILSAPARRGMKVVNKAARLFLRTIARVLGSEVLEDTMDFFAAFEGMYEGFHDRAARVRELLDDEGTAFCVIASPRRDALAEAEFFARQLGTMDHPVSAAIVNRMHPSFVPSLAEATRLRAETLGSRQDPASIRLADLYANLAAFQDVAAREDAELGGLRELIAPVPLAKVAFLSDDVHDFATLQHLEENLFPESPSPVRQGA
ncbi:MAG: ArsA family ATPase [Acidimicrobiia bacterium]|nr:ArsA family ATPase [Acidimicrobiia bacterium]